MDPKSNINWTGQHVFSQPIVFARSQVFDATGLYLDGQCSGDLFVRDRDSWIRLPVGASGQILTSVGKRPMWANLDIGKVTTGVLPLSHGGLGISEGVKGGIFVSSGDAAECLPVGTEGQVLSVVGGLPRWSTVSESQSFEPQLQECSCVDVLKHTASGLSINHLGTSLVLTDGGLQLTVDGARLFDVSVDGILGAQISTTSLKGVVDVAHGGTGIGVVSDGDLLVGKSKRFTRIGSQHNEGKYLKVVNGMPSWVEVEWVQPNSMKDRQGMLIPGTTKNPPLQFRPGQLTTVPQAGALEWDGADFYGTSIGAKRRKLAYDDSDITGLAAGVSEVVPMEKGGTGCNMRGVPPGALVIVGSDSSLGALPDKDAGNALVSQGAGRPPQWSPVVREVLAIQGSGVVVDPAAPFTPSLGVDTSPYFNPRWEGRHTFIGGVDLRNPSIGGCAVFVPGSQTPPEFSLFREGDDLFYNKPHEVVNLTQIKVDPPMVEHIRIEGLTPAPNSLRSVRMPLPFGRSGAVRWRLIRVDFRSEEVPVGGPASVNLLLRGQRLFDPWLTIPEGEDSVCSSEFLAHTCESGDLLQVAYGDVNGSDCWSIYVLLEAVD